MKHNTLVFVKSEMKIGRVVRKQRKKDMFLIDMAPKIGVFEKDDLIPIGEKLDLLLVERLMQMIVNLQTDVFALQTGLDDLRGNVRRIKNKLN